MKLLSLVYIALFTTASWAAPSGGVQPLLIFVSGGYTSCGDSSVVSGKSPYGMGMYANARSLIVKAQEKLGRGNVEYIVNCLNSDEPPRGDGRYFTSDSPKKIISGNGYDIADEIKARLKERPKMRVSLVGHSYGGWLVMFLTEELSAYDVELDLFTLDPISPETCGPLEVVFGASGCHQAPKDRDEALIAESTQNWINFFQRQDSWLTSSAIKEADKNYKVSYRGPHTDIDSDKRVWNLIVPMTLKEVKEPKR